MPASPRCAVHPARPAVDHCPVCGRPRCGADAISNGAVGCGVCAGSVATTAKLREHDANRRLGRLTSGALVASAVGLVGGFVSSQYVGAGAFSLITPFIVGMLCGAAATKAAHTDGRDRFGTVVRLVAVVYAVIGAAYAFRFVPGSESPFSPLGTVLPPYVAAAAGTWLWTLPPRRRGRKAQDRGSRAK